MTRDQLATLKQFCHIAPLELLNELREAALVFLDYADLGIGAADTETLPLWHDFSDSEYRLAIQGSTTQQGLRLPFARTAVVAVGALSGFVDVYFCDSSARASDGSLRGSFRQYEARVPTRMRNDPPVLGVHKGCFRVNGQWSSGRRIPVTCSDLVSRSLLPFQTTWPLSYPAESNIRLFLETIAAFHLPCFYRVKTTPMIRDRGKSRVIRDFSIYRVMRPNRLYKVYAAAGGNGDNRQDVEMPPHSRRAHPRYHWKSVGIDRRLLPSDPRERLRVAELHRVPISWIEACWVGDPVFYVGGVRYEVMHDLAPNAGKAFDHRLIKFDRHLAEASSCQA